MLKMVHCMRLEEEAKKKLEEFLHNVHNRNFVWMDEILEEAIKMFNSGSDGEPDLMPKTPSQKNRRKKKRLSSVKKDSFSTKRLSKREGTRSSKRIAQSLQHKNKSEIQVADEENTSPCRRVTRSRAVKSARHSDAALKNTAIHLAKGRIPLVEISINERSSAEFKMEETQPQSEKVALTLTLPSDDRSSKKRSQTLSKAALLVVPDTPEAKIMKEGREACKLKIANVSIARTTANKKPNAQEEKSCVQQEENSQPSKMEVTENVSGSPQTPTAPKANRHSVRRSLIGRTSMNCKASLVERCSLGVKREKMVRKSIGRALPKRKTTQRSSSACRRRSSRTAMEKLVDEQISESGPESDPTSHSQEVDENLRMSLRSHNDGVTVTMQPQEELEEGGCNEGRSEKSDEVQAQPQSARRKPSYKRAVNELDGGQHSEDELSPPRKKAPSPQCPASNVVRPFKTFLHTVHKNKMLMMTPGSMSRNSTIKSFLRQNTPLRTTPKEKERQRLENLKKREEAEQQRKHKLEEERRRRLEEMKRKREERLRKVLQARERVEQMEEEKKKRLEQKLAQHEEKNEKVREEKMAEDKVKKKAAAKKLEELEARRKQDEEVRKQRALQLEEEERRHKELMQKKREEEEHEKARKIAEQRRADLEREKKMSAEREREKKKEQERLQAQREHERQEKEKAARLQRELLAAAKEKERLKTETEEKERKLQEQRKQEEQQQKAASEAEVTAAHKQLNVTVDIENSPVCNSYQMTPQGPKQPKLDLNNYGMDLNSDDSTDDESQPRKPIPSWASGNQLSQAIIRQYYNPPDTKVLFGVVKSPKLEEIFYKSKPRYFKRTSSAVWNSPPFPGGKSVSSTFKRC
ncbi:inner centromere protein [Elgaria multicarinata webbii]|uniref:inner centromere protein n=1 Tax=Elgaria multicarinata webbii TaxID=159646 RepID=UPI002FCD4E7D